MSDPQELSRQASAFLKERQPGRYWKERRQLDRKVKLQRDLERLREEASPRPKAERPGFVYVIGCAGHPVKIGVAADVAKRVAGIQTGFPHPLRVYFQTEASDARKVEREAHARLSKFRLSGEWFDCEPAQAIEAIQAVMRPVAA